MPKDMVTILFVDDEEQFLESMGKRLEARGFHVIAVNRSIKAMSAARKNTVDVALVDLKMPGMNGNELVQLLKKEHPWIEVIVLTGHGGVEAEAQCARDGAFAYLRKPCTLDEVLEAVAKAYKHRLMKKANIKEDSLDRLIHQNNPGGSVLGALKAMNKIENEILET